MSEYYFFNSVKKSQEIEQWFQKNLRGIVFLEHTAPVTFTIDHVTYAIRYNQENDYIYTIKLHGHNTNIRGYHADIRNRVERYLNKLKSLL